MISISSKLYHGAQCNDPLIGTALHWWKHDNNAAIRNHVKHLNGIKHHADFCLILKQSLQDWNVKDNN